MKKLQNEKGFTLVELMIVVAIIGILAAIAIPQFNAYRIRGFNASAQSDIKNVFNSEAALFATAQQYGPTFTQAVATPFAPPAPAAAAGAPAIGGDAHNDYGISTFLSDGTTVRGDKIAIGNGVVLVVDTNVIPGPVNPGPVAGAFLTASKHSQGDTTFAMDSDSTAMYQNENKTNAINGDGCQPAGAALDALPASLAANTINVDNIAGVGTWTIR